MKYWRQILKKTTPFIIDLETERWTRVTAESQTGREAQSTPLKTSNLCHPPHSQPQLLLAPWEDMSESNVVEILCVYCSKTEKRLIFFLLERRAQDHVLMSWVITVKMSGHNNRLHWTRMGTKELMTQLLVKRNCSFCPKDRLAGQGWG